MAEKTLVDDNGLSPDEGWSRGKCLRVTQETGLGEEEGEAAETNLVSRAAERNKRMAAQEAAAITSQRRAPKGSDFTTSAARSTAGKPPKARPVAARASNERFARNRALAAGMRNAEELIMMGNAARGAMPSRLTRIMHGA